MLLSRQIVESLTVDFKFLSDQITLSVSERSNAIIMKCEPTYVKKVSAQKGIS